MTTRTQNEDIEAIKEELSRLRADVATLIEAMKKDKSASGGSSGKPATDDSGSDEWDELKAKIKEARNHGEEISRELGEEVRKHPIASVGIAFGIGYLASKIIR